MTAVPGEAGRGTRAGPSRYRGTARSTAAKILQSIGVVAAWAAVVGLGTFGTFSDPATPLTSVVTGADTH
jgi:hypothetical protein